MVPDFTPTLSIYGLPGGPQRSVVGARTERLCAIDASSFALVEDVFTLNLTDQPLSLMLHAIYHVLFNCGEVTGLRLFSRGGDPTDQTVRLRGSIFVL